MSVTPDGPPERFDAEHGDSSTQREEIRRLRVLLNRLPALIGYWDRELRNDFANDAYVDYFGFTPHEARGRHIREVLGETVYGLNRPYIQRALAGEEQLFERTLIDQHGMTRYTQASYLPDIVDGRVLGFYVQVTDVTARVEAERARDEALRLFEISMTNAPFGKAVLTTAARTLQINPALCSLLGYSPDHLIGRDFRELIHSEDRPIADTELMQLQDGRVPQISSELRFVRCDGTTIWLQRNAVLVPGAHGGEDIIIAQFQDVTARRCAEAELARLALTDPLTGLHNRYALTEAFRQLREVNPAAPVGIIFVDLDGFKQVNDAHGHAIGDTILVYAAQLLIGIIAPPNTAHRMGGDEFVVFCPNAGPEAVEALADSIRSSLSGRYPTTVMSVCLAASVGWARGATEGLDALLRQADADMYRHKAQRLRPGDSTQTN